MIKLTTPSWEIDNIEAVLFDKDGTLIDSHVYWGTIIERRSRALIKKLNLDQSYHKLLCLKMGFSLVDRRLLPEGPIALVSREEVIKILYEYFRKNGINISEQEIATLFMEVHSDFMNEIYDYIKILPGVKDLLSLLRDKGIKTAVITTDSIKNTEKILHFLGLSPYFDLSIGKETATQPKITGIPALIAVKSLKVNTKNTVCIGDAPMDIIMSKKANLRAGIGVALGQIPFEELLKYTNFVINDYSELAIYSLIDK